MRWASLLALLLALSGCSILEPLVKPAPSPAPMTLVAPPPDPRQVMIEGRKDALIRQLAICESGDWGPSEKRIYGGRGLYHGRLQFMVRTVQNFVLQMDGRALTVKEATDIAHDYDRAADLAKYIIFDLDGIGNWPACARKLNLRAEIAAIRQL
jgi:hypothetical protein